MHYDNPSWESESWDEGYSKALDRTVTWMVIVAVTLIVAVAGAGVWGVIVLCRAIQTHV